jgi:ribosome biogenesis GTPase
MAGKKKVRVDLRKNRSKPPRDHQWTRGFQEHGFTEQATTSDERVRAKGDLSRRRTIIQNDEATASGDSATAMPAAAADCLPGRVLRVHGLLSVVETADGRQYRCAVRRLLRTLTTDERNIVTTGDRVWITRTNADEAPAPSRGEEADAPRPSALEGVIERVEPRHGLLTRASRGREHVLVANVDQVVFVLSLVEPDLKPHLIDRYLASAVKGGIQPLLVLNKADLVDPVPYQRVVGLYCQLGVPTLLTSATSGRGLEELRRWLRDRQTVFSGQSGVGKSSLLNAVQPDLGLRVREVSDGNGRAPVLAVGHPGGGSRGPVLRVPPLRDPVRLPRLHPHPRGPLRRQARRPPSPDHRRPLFELSRHVRRGSGVEKKTFNHERHERHEKRQRPKKAGREVSSGKHRKGRSIGSDP